MRVLKYLPASVLWILIMAIDGHTTHEKPFWVLKFSFVWWSGFGMGVIFNEREAGNKKVIGLPFWKAMKLVGRALLCGPYTREVLHL